MSAPSSSAKHRARRAACCARLACAALLFAGLFTLPARGDTVTIFAAASLRGALEAALDGAPVRIAYAGSAALARQLIAGAPADIFISANAAWMDTAEAAGVTTPASRKPLLTNRLALVAFNARVGPTPLSRAAVLEAAGKGPIAMALVDAVPAGIYGKAALTALGLWERLSDRVVQADNVRAALLMVSRGGADTGIVYATDAALAPDLTVVGLFGADTHGPIVYPAALTTGASPAARAVFDALFDKETRQTFDAFGFGRPSDG
ncbi:MAG: molybdate ABC transporter substrate-binding protein [Pseudomonadota bacterium]